jgi:anti-sigma B factor antagonist
MRIKEKIVDGIAILSISGKMMGGPEQQACHEQVRGLISDNINRIVIDLGKVEWLNSSGLGLLMGCLASCRGANGDLAIARAGRKVNSVFMLTQVIKVFETFETVEEAIDFLNSPKAAAE